jgi:Protein of unknown function (DUF3807)
VSKEGKIEPGELVDTDSSSREVEEEGAIIKMPTPPSSSKPPAKMRQKSGKKSKKAEQARQKGWFKQNIKPDLRKRTWDKVDSGLGNLDYDEDSIAALIPDSASQRRRISYDD